MKQDVLKNFDIDWIPVLGLILFVICFSSYVYFTYKKSNKSFFEKIASLPLEDATSKSNKTGDK